MPIWTAGSIRTYPIDRTNLSLITVTSDQLVTLETVIPSIKVRIVGITPDHGLLRTLPEGSRGAAEQDFIDLQPDGNSFDMMAGLIKTKR